MAPPSAPKSCVGTGWLNLSRLSMLPRQGALRIKCENSRKGFIFCNVIYTDHMEYGPRALGARSILASSTQASINDKLNRRLSRTEFMPFTPVVSENDASQIFELSALNLYAARFMTITCSVRPEWRTRIPAVVHVETTARPQVIQREWYPLYFGILDCYKRNTELPVLTNTSFNIHEEPIINNLAEFADALADDWRRN